VIEKYYKKAGWDEVQQQIITLLLMSDNIDLPSASGTLQFNIISAFTQCERDTISERTGEGLKHAKNVGKRGKDKKRRRKSGYYQRWINKSAGEGI